MNPTLTPESISEAAKMLGTAYRDGTRVRVQGSGSADAMGYDVDSNVVLSTAGLTRIEAWEPGDLTAVVEAGVSVRELESTLSEARQSAVISNGEGTVGGIVATGRSGFRRLRYGPTRDRMLEVTLVTGDGRVVTGGGRLVKNVTGFDLPRLATGSFGSLGLIARVCFKLWPIPQAAATVRVESAESARLAAYRPLALLETPEGVSVYLEGTADAVDGQAIALGGERTDGHDWPDAPRGHIGLSLRVPPSEVAMALGRLDPSWDFVAQHGVGEIAIAGEAVDPDALVVLRGFAEQQGGGLVVTAGEIEGVDPWGTPPATLELQRRLIAQFDPSRLINPGILPGGL